MKTSLLPLALLLGSASLAAAENLETLVVTATGYPVKLVETPASMEVITLDEIENSPGMDIADLLRLHTGLEIGRNGGPGQATSLFIRGTESDQNLVMIDGVPVNSGSVGSAALQHIDPQLIERIEIYKGPRSTLWGSGAIGGVINIITRRGGEGADWGGSLEAGEEHTRRAAARASWNQEGKRLSAAISHERTDGFPPLVGSHLDRGYDNTSFNLAVGMDVGIHRLDASHWQTRGNVEYLDYFGTPLDQDFLNSRSSLSWNTQFQDNWISLLELAHVRDHIDQSQRSDSVHTNRTELKWQNDIRVLESDRLLLGYKYSRESVEARGGFSPYDEDSEIHEAWAQYDLRRGAHHFIAGLRYLGHEDAGSKPTWSINYGFALSPATHLFASAATAFRVPSANERFGFGGNPDLDPETSTSYELGLRHQLIDGHQVAASLYRNDIDDMIQWILVNPPWDGYNRNIAEARIDGLELNYDYSGDSLSLHLGGNWQDPEDRTTGKQLLRRARYGLNARVGYDWNHWHIGASLLHSGDRKDFGNTTLDSYTLVNLDASYRFNDEWQLFAKLENAFDEDYQLASGYNTAGRTGYIGIRYR